MNIRWKKTRHAQQTLTTACSSGLTKKEVSSVLEKERERGSEQAVQSNTKALNAV